MTYGLLRRVDMRLKPLRGKGLTMVTEAIAVMIILVIALAATQVELIALITKDYGAMALISFILYFIPVITMDMYKDFRARG